MRAALWQCSVQNRDESIRSLADERNELSGLLTAEREETRRCRYQVLSSS